MKQFLIFLLMAGVLAGCGDSSDRVRTDANYFPLSENLYWIYDVSGTTYQEAEGTDFAYQLQVQVTDVIANADGTSTYVLLRSTRANDQEAWVAEATWTATATATELIVQESATPVVHLGFPARVNRSWNANEYNTEADDTYAITKARVSMDLENGLSFRDVVEVQQENRSTLIDRDQRREVFAYNVGLILKERFVLRYDDNGNLIPQEGILYEQRLSEYGKME